eukprot:XP_011675178.1 PREDICTED: replication protein A 70 kDa DNA-binding subunit [Strongylocentrotus purpuratus]
MNNLLSRGAIAAIFRGENVSCPVLQLLACKKMNAAASGKAVDRYRLMLSDGEHTCTAMLATQLNEMVSTGELDVKAAMKLKNYSCNPIANDRRVIVVLDLDIVKKGSEIGVSIGDPTPMRAPGQGGGPAPAQQQSRPDSTVSHDPPQTARPTSYGTGAAPASATPNKQGTFYGQSNSAMGGSTTSPKKVQPISSLTPYQNRTWWNNTTQMIEIGKVYFVSRGTLKPANRQYTSINNDYELTFNNDTMVEPCVEEDVSIPAVQFDFKSISHLEDTPEDSMIDVIGVCKSTSDLTAVTIKSSNREVNKRSLQLVDDSQNEPLASNSAEAEDFDGSGNPVIAVKGARLSGFGGRSLSVLQNSIFQVNPDIPKAHHLKGWVESLTARVTPQDSQSISTRQGSGGGGGANTNWMTFHDVHAQNLGQGEKPDYFTVKGTILFVRKENCMYMACPSAECNKKVSENGDGSYRCEKCSKDYENFKYRLLLSANVADSTDNQWATCFQETAEQLLLKSAQELGSLKDQGEATEKEFNQVFQDACFIDYMFRMRIKMETYNEEARLKCTCVSAQPINVRDYTNKLIKDIRLMASA